MSSRSLSLKPSLPYSPTSLRRGLLSETDFYDDSAPHNPSPYPCFEVPKSIVSSAEMWEREFVLNYHSIHKEGHRAHGRVAELIMAYLLEARHIDTPFADLETHEGITINVKNKICESPPTETFDSALFGYQRDFDCHVYAFCRTSRDFKYVWPIGWCTKGYFWQNATFYPERDIRQNPHHSHQYSYYGLPYKQLIPFRYAVQQ